MAVTVVAGGAYALWGLSPLAPRPDVLGAFWFACLLGFLALGRSRLLYVGAFVVVTYLELLGTVAAHLDVGADRPHRDRRDGQPALRGCRRLRLVRPGRGGHRTGAARRAGAGRTRPAPAGVAARGPRSVPDTV